MTMDTTMELDDFKAAWQSLEQRLQRQHELDLHLFRQGKLDRMRSGLRPLFWGQIGQMLWGLCFLALAILLWSQAPDALPVIVAGVVVHGYGVACIIMAGVTLGRMANINYSAPVLEIQKQLAKVRKTYVLSGMITGLPWWFLWVPVLMTVAGLEGADLYARVPSMVWIGTAIGIVGLLATWWFHRWSRDPRRPRLAQAMEDGMTGASLRKAKAQLDELMRFEHE
jgi:hypothetical protein